jgi:hypothetical protein
MDQKDHAASFLKSNPVTLDVEVKIPICIIKKNRNQKKKQIADW